jgi:hypothetical protein
MNILLIMFAVLMLFTIAAGVIEPFVDNDSTD